MRHPMQFLLLLFFTKYLLDCTGQYCTSQTIKFNEYEDIYWPMSTPNQHILSTPICLHQNYTFKTRTCAENGNWIPSIPPTCPAIQKSFQPICGPNTIRYEDLCIFISDPEPWSGRCPVVNVYNITNQKYLEILYKNNITDIWLPVKRSENYGKFIWKDINRMNQIYDHELLPKLLKYDSPNNNCIIGKIKKKDYIPEITNCSYEYPTVCIFPILSNYAVSTTNLSCSRNSIHCYYKEKNCNKYAEPLIPEDNYVIKNMISYESDCRIGLYQNESHLFTESGKLMNYTDWDLNVNFNPNISNIFISNNGWFLTKETNFNCSICEADSQQFKTYFTLKPNKNQNALILTLLYSYSQNFGFVCRVSGLDDIHLHIDSEEILSEPLNGIISNNFRKVWLITPNIPNYNYYQCFVETMPHGKVIKTKKILFGLDSNGLEYAFELKLAQFCKANNCEPYLSRYFENIEIKIQKKLHADGKYKVRSVKILNIDDTTGDLIMLMHIRTNKTDLIEEFHYLKKLLMDKVNNLSIDSSKLSLISFKSCDGCVPSVSSFENTTLHWNFTEIGTTTTPNEFCLQSNLLPITRMCVGNFLSGAEWMDVKQSCKNDIKPSNLTQHLYEIYSNHFDKNATEIMKILSSLTRKQLKPVDLYYISEILKNILKLNPNDNTTLIFDELSATISNLIASNITYLKLANQILNTSNTIIYRSGRIFETNGAVNGIFRTIKPNFIHQISDPFINNITGIAIYRKNSTEPTSFNEYIYKSLTVDTDINELIASENLEVAAYIPKELLQNLSNDVKIYFAIFYNDSMFVENVTKSRVNSKVLSVAIKGYDSYLQSPIKIIFRPKFETRDHKCAYWEFGSNVDENITYPSQWEIDGGISITSGNKMHQICEFTHLTNFALLLGNPDDVSFPNNSITGREIEFREDTILNSITIFGCTVSIFGICGIVTTAIVFKRWRDNIGTKILLNISGNCVLQIFSLYIADMNNFQKNTTVCIITGAVLHYAILSSFAWSLVAAFLQYFRFVRVTGEIPSHLLLKACIIGWCVPSLPVIVVLLIDAYMYVPKIESTPSLCYPQVPALYAVLFTPVITIVLTNLVIFSIILYTITMKTKFASTRMSERTIIGHQLKLAILLFFLMGLSWLFGLLAVVKRIDVLLYLFCATATLQGFILFLFYVVLDTKTRQLWIDLFKTKLKPKQQAVPDCMPQTTIETNIEENEYDDIYDVIKEVNQQEPIGYTVMKELQTELKTYRIDDDDEGLSVRNGFSNTTSPQL